MGEVELAAIRDKEREQEQEQKARHPVAELTSWPKKLLAWILGAAGPHIGSWYFAVHSSNMAGPGHSAASCRDKTDKTVQGGPIAGP